MKRRVVERIPGRFLCNGAGRLRIVAEVLECGHRLDVRRRAPGLAERVCLECGHSPLTVLRERRRA